MIARWILNSLIILALPYLVPGINVGSFWSALIVALVLGIVNALIRPILIVLTLPITLLTLGFFILVINALLLLFVSTIVKGFDVSGFWPAFFGSIVIWAGSLLTNSLLHQDRKNQPRPPLL